MTVNEGSPTKQNCHDDGSARTAEKHTTDPGDSGLRSYLRANMFDGDEGGTISMDIHYLLDEVCQNVTLWMVNAAGTGDFMDGYYG